MRNATSSYQKQILAIGYYRQGRRTYSYSNISLKWITRAKATWALVSNYRILELPALRLSLHATQKRKILAVRIIGLSHQYLIIWKKYKKKRPFCIGANTVYQKRNILQRIIFSWGCIWNFSFCSFHLSWAQK